MKYRFLSQVCYSFRIAIIKKNKDVSKHLLLSNAYFALIYSHIFKQGFNFPKILSSKIQKAKFILIYFRLFHKINCNDNLFAISKFNNTSMKIKKRNLTYCTFKT